MDNVKGDLYYLNKILTDLQFVITHTTGKTKEEIQTNELLLDSIMFRLIQIAENSEKLSAKFKETHAQIPWRAIKGMRNRIVHDYGVVDATIVYSTVTQSIPELYKDLNELI